MLDRSGGNADSVYVSTGHLPAADSITALVGEAYRRCKNFVSNDHLRDVLARTSAMPTQVDEAVRLNTASRLRALKIGLRRPRFTAANRGGLQGE